MKILFFILTIVLGNQIVYAQSDLHSIMESEIVKDKLTFHVIGGQLYMESDDGVIKPLEKETSLQGKSKTIIFNHTFIHPLKYRISFENELIEDELTKAAQEYLTQFINYLTHVSKGIGEGASGQKIKTALTEIEIKNPELIELYFLLNGYNKDFFNKTPSSQTEMLEAMGKINDQQLEADIISTYEIIFNNIWEINSYESISKATTANKALLDTIDNKISEIQNSYENLDIKVHSFEMDYYKQEGKDKNLVSLIKTKITEMKESHVLFKKQKDELKTKYDAFKKLLDEIKDKTFSDDGKNETQKDHITFEKGKRNKLSIYLKIFDYNSQTKSLNEKEQKTFTLYLRKYQSFIPIVASGVLYSNLTFNTYGTDTNDEGETIVTQGENKDNEIAVAAYLNLYYNNGWENPVFFQVGVGPSKEKPLLFTGLGISIGSRFSLSGGAVFTWAPTLDELSIGDTVTGTTQIEDDILHKFTNSPKFYLGLSFDLSK